MHELGHFFVAKWSKVKVEEFGVGYPPRALTFGVWGGTEYTLNWLPFGGFVRLFGDEGHEKKGKGSLVDASRGKQALILVAGVAANAILGWTLFALAFHAGIPRIVDDPTTPGAHLIVSDVVQGSPAHAAGLKAGDVITHIGVAGESVQATDQLTPEFVSDFVRERGGEPIILSYERSGELMTTTLIPAHAVIPDEVGRPALGIALALVSTEPMGWGKSFTSAFIASKNALTSVIQGLWTLIDRAIHGAPDISDVIGPVGLVSAVGDAAHNGWGNVLALAAFISLNLAVINLIPIPALDGGRLVLLGIEAVMRRPAPRVAVLILNALGVSIIGLLMITVTFNDIARLF